MSVTFATPNIEELRREHLLVDMHFHSRYSHDCSTPVRSIITRARSLGVYVALTDHNEIRGVLEGERVEPGRIKPGIEVTTKEGKDILVYFYTVRDLQEFFETHLKQHIRNGSSIGGNRTGLSLAGLLKATKQYPCILCIAHPFAVGVRMSYRFFRGKGAHFIQRFHAIEVVNQAIPHRRNLASIGLAEQYRKTMVGGSDGHIVKMLGSAFTYARADSWEEFLHAIKKNNVSVIGEEQKLREHVMNMARILREKTKVIKNRRIKNGA